MSDGMIQNVDLYGKELQNQLRKNGVMNAKDVTFTVSSSRTLAREVMIPPVKENRIAQTVEANATEYLPVGLDDYGASLSRALPGPCSSPTLSSAPSAI